MKWNVCTGRWRVCDLRVVGYGVSPDPFVVAQLLRAAPQLRKFSCRRRLQEGAVEWLNHPAFTGLVHPRLRSIDVDLATHAEPAPADCGMQLRRLYFPRLQQLIENYNDNSVQHLMHNE
jgi:hypothetical protein